MKKFINLFISVVLIAGAVACDHEELNSQSSQIASISSQISSIQSSISNLEKLDAELKSRIEVLSQSQQELASLIQEEEALAKRIDELKAYVDQELKKQTDWVNATFSTLEQYQSTCNEIASLKQGLSSLDTTLKALIASTETAIRSWVNEQLTGYYTIAEIHAKVATLEKNITDGDEAQAQELAKLKTDLETAQTNIKTAYEKAISDAITSSEGKINEKIAADIKTATDALQSQIDAITTRLGTIEGRISDLETAVSQLIESIQSIVVVPDYADGSVRMTGLSNNTLRFEIYPLTAAEKLAQAGTASFSLDCIETATKSSLFTHIPITAVSFDGEVLSVEADGSFLPEDIRHGSHPVNARLRVSDGAITRSSAYFGLDFRLLVVTGGNSVTESSAELFGWCHNDGLDDASVRYGFELVEEPYDFDYFTTMKFASEKNADNQFSCRFKLLSPNSTYYYRAIAIYNGIKSYGEIKSLTTRAIQATVTTQAATNVQTFFGTLNGTLSLATLDEFSPSVGFYYSTEKNDLESLMASGTRLDCSLNNDGSFSSFLFGLPENTPVYYVAWASVYYTLFWGEVESFTTTSELLLQDGAIDMGLSVKWASSNLDESGFVSSPELYGDYYAWGETAPYYSNLDPLTWKDGKTGYNWASYGWCNGSSSSLTKYNAEDNKAVLEEEDDVAHVKLGGKWRMPTFEEWSELLTNCQSVRTDYKGVSGRLVIGPNGNTIFLPAAGRYNGTSLSSAGSVGGYWSSSLNTNQAMALSVNFNSNVFDRANSSRNIGYPIRPVSD